MVVATLTLRDVHQRGLASTVLTQKGQHLSFLQGEVYAVVGQNAGECLGDIASLKYWSLTLSSVSQ
jgi:hypothetical protein